MEKYSPTIDKRTQLTGKAGPEKSRREEDNPKSAADDNQYVTNKRFNDLFSLMGQLVKNSNLQNENQGQGRRGDRYRIDYKERHHIQRQGGGDRCKQQSREYDESRQYANTATESGWRSGKRFDKHGSSDESCGEDTHHSKQHFAHLAFKDDMFSSLNRERRTNIEYDRGKMPNFAYPGSEFSEHDQPFDKTEDHETTEESFQQSPKDQSLEGYHDQEEDERKSRSDGNISKIKDPSVPR